MDSFKYSDQNNVDEILPFNNNNRLFIDYVENIIDEDDDYDDFNDQQYFDQQLLSSGSGGGIGGGCITSSSNHRNNSFCISPLVSKEKINDSDVDVDLFEHEFHRVIKNFNDFLLSYAFTEQATDKTNISLNSRKLKISKALQRKLGSFSQMLKKFDPDRQLNESGDLNDQIKLFNYLEEYKRKIIRSLRSLVERVCCDTIIPDSTSNSNQVNSNKNGSTLTQQIISVNSNPTSKLWAEIRARGCQFLGPEMQDDVLRLIIFFLNKVTRISRKGLVSWIVLKLQNTYSKASRTSVGHVIQLLYRAGCFNVEKRENESSSMELRREYLNYDQLRKQHDNQIITIAMESGIYMSPEQWSQKLYGDSNHKSKMQSIIDKIHSKQTLKKSIQDFFKKLDKYEKECGGGGSQNAVSLFKEVEEEFQLFSNMEENIFNNICSKSLSTSDSQSIIDDLNSNSDGESASIGDQSNQSNQQQMFYYLPWDYVDKSIKACISILNSSFNFNNNSSTLTPIQQQQTSFMNNGMKLSRPQQFTASIQQQKLLNYELQARSSIVSSNPYQQQCIAPQKFKQQQFQFNNKKSSSIQQQQQQPILNQFKKKDNGFARQFPPTFPQQEQQSLYQHQSYFNNNQQAQLIAQYNQQQNKLQNSFLQQHHHHHHHHQSIIDDTNSYSPFKTPFMSTTTNNTFQQQVFFFL
jgi:hypothetical protein